MYFDAQDFMASSSHASLLPGTFEDEVRCFMTNRSLAPDSSQSSGGLNLPRQVYEGLLENTTSRVIEGYDIPTYTMHHDNRWQQPFHADYPVPIINSGGSIPGRRHPMVAAGELPQYMAGVSTATALPSYSQVHDHAVHVQHHMHPLLAQSIARPPLVHQGRDTALWQDMAGTRGNMIRSDTRSEDHEAKDHPTIHVQQQLEIHALHDNNFTSKARNDGRFPITVALSPDTVQLSAGGPGAPLPAVASQSAAVPWRSTTMLTKERRSRKANTPSPWACFHLACRKKDEPLYFGRRADLGRHNRHAKVHAPPSHKCPHEGCKTATTRKEALTNHIAKKHTSRA
ncbi:hypothetical protein EW146_g3456 [Bondarzewia mesenterica]|uniref:C2H2-type domain-containing protein n=1 Tax=Bondarzewia mesenterica TaxID=1095465 RepID=A0A4S4LZC0_9AGAM|nr:hypothetical protein EW146_g3456 [Bondarzewia mesenterica]